MKVDILTTHLFFQLKEIHGEDRIIFGGAERYIIELCRLLRDLGHEPTIYQGHREYKGTINREYDKIPVISNPYEDFNDLVTSFNEYSIWADLRIYFAPFLTWPHVRRPAMCISHGIFWDTPTHRMRMNGEDYKHNFLKRQLHAVQIPMVAVDTNVRNFYAAYEPGSEQNVHVIPNFVDTDKFTPKTERTWERPRILYPRRLTTIRGINEFIKASSQFPEADFYICGNGLTGEMENQLKQWTDTIPNVFSVWHPMEEMPPVYKECDIAIVPTRAAEGTSLSCIEAMAAGLPVITTPVGGLTNLIIDRYNGLVVDLNHGGLEDPIRFLLDNPHLWEVYGKRNRDIAVESFSLKVWREKWTKFLERW